MTCRHGLPGGLKAFALGLRGFRLSVSGSGLRLSGSRLWPAADVPTQKGS